MCLYNILYGYLNKCNGMNSVLLCKILYINVFVLLMVLAVCRGGAAGETATPGAGVPILITLDRPAYVTVVIDDAAGNRVRTLVSAAAAGRCADDLVGRLQ